MDDRQFLIDAVCTVGLASCGLIAVAIVATIGVDLWRKWR